MKKYFNWLAVSLLAVSVLTMGCDPDEFVPTPVADAPTITGDNLVFTNASFEGSDVLGTLTTFTVTTVKGTDALNTLTVTVDGEQPADGDITITDAEGTDLTNNPLLIVSGEGATYDVLLRLPSEFDVVSTYNFEVADVNGLTGSVSVDVMVTNPGTPIIGDLTGVLLNQAGPTGTGGLDLDAGNGTGSADPDAELRDSGIDTAQPDATNWKQTISTVNNANLRYVGTALTEGDFASVATKEAILAEWNAATELVDNTSSVVNVGDHFAVESNGLYYLLEVTDVTVTTDDNDDSYTFNIKF